MENKKLNLFRAPVSFTVPGTASEAKGETPAEEPDAASQKPASSVPEHSANRRQNPFSATPTLKTAPVTAKASTTDFTNVEVYSMAENLKRTFEIWAQMEVAIRALEAAHHDLRSMKPGKLSEDGENLRKQLEEVRALQRSISKLAKRAEQPAAGSEMKEAKEAVGTGEPATVRVGEVPVRAPQISEEDEQAAIANLIKAMEEAHVEDAEIQGAEIDDAEIEDAEIADAGVGEDSIKGSE